MNTKTANVVNVSVNQEQLFTLLRVMTVFNRENQHRADIKSLKSLEILLSDSYLAAQNAD